MMRKERIMYFKNEQMKHFPNKKNEKKRNKTKTQKFRAIFKTILHFIYYFIRSFTIFYSFHISLTSYLQVSQYINIISHNTDGFFWKGELIHQTKSFVMAEISFLSFKIFILWIKEFRNRSFMTSSIQYLGLDPNDTLNQRQ